MSHPALPHRPAAPWRGGLATLALAGLTLLQACGSGDDAPAAEPPVTRPGTNPQLQAAAPGDLVAYAQQRLRQRGTGTPQAGAPAPAPTTGSLARSTSTVQEAGVDEADRLKTDGLHLYSLLPRTDTTSRLQIHRRAADGSVAPLQTLVLAAPGAIAGGPDALMLSDDGRTAAVLAESWEPQVQTTSTSPPAPPTTGPVHEARVAVQRVDVSDPATATPGTRISLQGWLVGSRRIGDALLVVTRHSPVLALDQLPPSDTAAREAAIAALTAPALLPNKTVDGGPAQPLVAESDCYIHADNASTSLETTTVTVFDLRSPVLASSSRCIAGGTEALYMSPTSLVLATTRYSYIPGDGPRVAMIFPEEMDTDVHKFALAGNGVVAGIDYRGSATVRGHLGWDGNQRPYRFGEHAGALRVLTYTGSSGWAVPADAGSTTPPSPARLTVLREDPASRTLRTVATLPNTQRPEALGKPDEQIYGVRFTGTRGYVVTFRRTDPLYVLDLADDADPRIAGALEVPGFSEHLYPLDGRLLFGVGRDADTTGAVGGLRFTLFDVQDMAQPRLLHSVVLGGVQSQSALSASPQGINFFERGGQVRIALPVDLAVEVTTQQTLFWQRGLQRFEVDLAAATLRTLPLLGATEGPQAQDLASDRSVQIEDHVYHLRSGNLTGHGWAP